MFIQVKKQDFQVSSFSLPSKILCYTKSSSGSLRKIKSRSKTTLIKLS